MVTLACPAFVQRISALSLSRSLAKRRRGIWIGRAKGYFRRSKSILQVRSAGNRKLTGEGGGGALRSFYHETTSMPEMLANEIQNGGDGHAVHTRLPPSSYRAICFAGISTMMQCRCRLLVMDEKAEEIRRHYPHQQTLDDIHLRRPNSNGIQQATSQTARENALGYSDMERGHVDIRCPFRIKCVLFPSLHC